MSNGPITWRETRERMRRDRDRLREMIRARFGIRLCIVLFHPCYLPVALSRISHYLYRRGRPKAAGIVANAGQWLTGFDFHPHCDIGGGLLLMHPTGASISGRAGRDLTLSPLGGLGMTPDPRDVGAGPGHPLVGDGVIIGPHAGALGPVLVGDRVRIAAGSVVSRDVPPDLLVEPAETPVQLPRGVRAPHTDEPHPPAPSPCPHASIRASWRDFLADLDAYLAEVARHRGPGGFMRTISALATLQLCATGLYRFSHCAHARGWRRLARLLCHCNILIHRVTISPAACIGGGLFLPHPAGTVLNCRAGRNLTLYARALITSRTPALSAPVEDGPILGDNVIMAAQSAAIGPVRLGHRARIAANAVVTASVPDDSLVATAAFRLKAVGPDGYGDGSGGAGT